MSSTIKNLVFLAAPINLSSSDDQRITEDAFSYKMLNRILHHIHLPPIPSETHLAKAYYS